MGKLFKTVRTATSWTATHPDDTMALFGAVAVTIMSGLALADKVNQEHTRYVKKHSIYDGTSQQHIRLKRLPTESEKMRVAELMRAGYTRREAYIKIGLI